MCAKLEARKARIIAKQLVEFHRENNRKAQDMLDARNRPSAIISDIPYDGRFKGREDE